MTRRYLTLVAIVSLWQTSYLQAQQKYDNPRTKEVVGKMVHTMPPDGSTTYGFHTVINYSMTEPFDEARLKKSAHSIVDKTTHLRQSQQ